MINLSKDVWGKIFIDYFTYDELIHPYSVCKLWRLVISDAKVIGPIMLKDHLHYDSNEHWHNAFYQRKIIIALDCSNSMHVGSESWRFTEALAKVKAFITRFQNFAAKEGILFIPFATFCTSFIIRKVDEIDIAMINRVTRKIRRGNLWKFTFNSIYQAIDKTKKNSIYILSDFELASNDHALWKTANEIIPLIYLCRVGNSISGKTFIDSLIGQDDAEPTKKKQKVEAKTIIHYEHISSKTGEPSGRTLSRTPTEIVEHNDPMIEEFEEDSISLTASDSEEESDSNSWLY
jgi:hypothetical protein